MISFTQGFQIRFPGGPDRVLVAVSNAEKHISEGGPGFTGEETAAWTPGVYRYQLIDPVGVVEQGAFELHANLALVPEGAEVMPARKILEAIDAQIAGKATAAQASVSIGDKSITYYSLTELLRLRQYYADRVAEEQGQAPATAERRIIYSWRTR